MADGASGVDGEFDIAEYCGRLTCRELIVQTVGRGRRREFCSETCRRGADRDYKRAKAMVTHFEDYLTRTRYEVAAYGRKAESDAGLRTPLEELAVSAAAGAAVSRAEGILEFASADDDRYLAELRRLVEAIKPLVISTAVRATA